MTVLQSDFVASNVSLSLQFHLQIQIRCEESANRRHWWERFCCLWVSNEIKILAAAEFADGADARGEGFVEEIHDTAINDVLGDELSRAEIHLDKDGGGQWYHRW